MWKNMANRIPLVKSSRGDVAVPQVQILTPGDEFLEGARLLPCTAPMGAVLQVLRTGALVFCSGNGDTGWVAVLLRA